MLEPVELFKNSEVKKPIKAPIIDPILTTFVWNKVHNKKYKFRKNLAIKILQVFKKYLLKFEPILKKTN